MESTQTVPTYQTSTNISQAAEDERTKEGCFIVKDHSEPWNNPQDLLTNEVIISMNLYLSIILIPTCFLVGIFGNILCAVVFYKQSLKDRITLCLFSLALADLFNVFGYLCIQMELVSRGQGGESYFFITYLLSLQGFTWVSMYLSTVIASERCFCVVSPLKAKQVLETSTMAILIVLVSFLLMAVFVVVIGTKHNSACVFDPATNRTSSMVYVTDFYLKNKTIIDIIDIFIYTTAFPILFIVVIIITTVITAAKLRTAATWRRDTANIKTTATASRAVSPSSTTTSITSSSAASSATTTKPSSGQEKGGMSRREVSVTRMLIGTSVLFIICNIPAVFGQIAIFSVSELRNGGRYHNTFNAIWTIVTFLRVLNCSVNVFFYLYMGSKFRETLLELLPCCSKKGDKRSTVYSLNSIVTEA